MGTSLVMDNDIATFCRYWEKTRVDENGCWRRGNGHGYKMFMFNGKNIGAHRYAYRFFVGQIPDGLTLDHLCRQPNCSNPEHLEPVDMKENLLRGEGAPASNARKTHCKHGHEFTPDNTYPRKTKYGEGRGCRTCYRAYDVKRRKSPERKEYDRVLHRRKRMEKKKGVE